MANPRVLMIRLSSLGDVVLSTSAVEAFASTRPGERLDILTKPAFKEVFRGNPAVGEVLTWEADESPLAMAKKLRTRQYDYIIDLHDNLRTRALRFLVRGVKWSVYKKGSLRRRCAVALRAPGRLAETHVVERYAAAFAPLGVPVGITLPRLYPSREDEELASTLLGGELNELKTPVALAPGARWATKGWPKTKWVELIRTIAKEGRVLPVMVGGDSERELCAELLERGGVPGINAAGKCTILETAALLGRCEGLVTGDSAPLHIACAVGTPVVALFGPTVRGFGFYPLGEDDRVIELEIECRPCSLHGGDHCPKGHFNCMEGIAPDRVQRALLDIIDSGKAP